MDYKAKLIEALKLLGGLQDVIEKTMPCIYFQSKDIAKLNDFWLELENDSELSEVIKNL